MTPLEPPTLAELLRRITPGPGGCWIWTGAVDGRGYGHVGRSRNYGMERKDWIVHRLVYELAVGPVPAGYDIHHICEVRRCIYPKHLEPVTRREHQGLDGRHPDHMRAALRARGYDLIPR